MFWSFPVELAQKAFADAAIVEFAPFLIPIMALMIPIVAILTGHQRKMAEMIRRDQQAMMSASSNHEIQALREEVRQLKEVVNQQVLAMDDLRTLRSGNAEEAVRVRTSSGE